MDDAPVRRRHGLQGYASVGLRHAAGDLGGHIAQRVLPALAVVLHVQHHPHVFSQLLANDEGHQELQGLERLASASDEQAGVLSCEVNDRPARLRVVGRAQGTGDVDPGSLQDLAHGSSRQCGGCLLPGVGGYG